MSTSQEAKPRSEAEIRAELAAQIIAARTGHASPRGAARRAGRTGVVGRIVDAPAPPRSVNDPLYAVYGLGVLGGLCHLADVSWYWLVAGGGLAALGGGYEVHQALQHKPTTAFAAGSALAAGGVAAVWAERGPGAGVAAAGLGLAAAMPVYGALRHRHDKRNTKELQERKQAREEFQKDQWEQIIAKSGAKDVRIDREVDGQVPDEDGRVQTWVQGRREFPEGSASPNGFALALELGPDAPTGEELAAMTPKMEKNAARMARLPVRSGAIQVRCRGFAHQWELIVPTKDVLREEIPFVPESGPRSINDPLYAAMSVDGTALGVDWMVNPHAMWGGRNNSGKTNFMNVHMAETTRCTDAVTWAICGAKSHRLFVPWMRPFLAGTEHLGSPTGFVEPVLDWIAGDSVEEACRMLADAYKAIYLRSQMAAETGEEKLTPSPKVPRILLFIDESPNLLLSNFKVKPFDWDGPDEEHDRKYNDGVPTGCTYSELLTKVLRLGRSEAVSIIFLTQRTTNSMIGTDGGDLRSQISYAVSFRQNGSIEQNSTFTGVTTGVDVATLRQGELYMQVDEFDRPVLGKAYRIEREAIEKATREHTVYAQPLDPGTADGLDFYAERWTRPDQQAYLRSLMPGAVRTVPGQRPAGRTEIASDPAAAQIPDVPPSIAAAQRASIDESQYSAEALAAMFPDVDESLNNLDVGLDADGDGRPDTPLPWGEGIDPALPLGTRQLLDLLARSNLLCDEWLPTVDIVALAAAELGWNPSESKGAEQVKAALAEAGVDQPPRRKGRDEHGKRFSLPSGYWVEQIVHALERFQRPTD